VAVAGDQHRVQAEHEELGRAQRVSLRVGLAPVACESDRPHHQGHHGVIRPLAGVRQHLGAARGEVQREHLAEERPADPALHLGHQPDNLVQCAGQVMRPGEELLQLGGQPCLLMPL